MFRCGEVHRTSERRGVNLGMTPGVSWILFHYKWNLVVGRKLPTAGYLHGDYDFGVVPKAPCNARVVCSKSNLVLHTTYLAMSMLTS